MSVKKRFCQKGHELTEDNVRISYQNGQQRRTCLICNREYHKNRQARLRQERFMDDPVWASRYYRNRKLKEKYGITLEEFESLLKEQNNKCFLCNFEFPEDSKFSDKPCVDHCHKTGQVRKVLCHACNRGMGLLKDDPALLRKMADYIESYQIQEQDGELFNHNT